MKKELDFKELRDNLLKEYNSNYQQLIMILKQYNPEFLIEFLTLNCIIGWGIDGDNEFISQSEFEFLLGIITSIDYNNEKTKVKIDLKDIEQIIEYIKRIMIQYSGYISLKNTLKENQKIFC